MKLQNMIIIFLAIALPVIIILSVYVELQVDTAMLREQYRSILINATHETVVAFELNTNNDKFVHIADSKFRDIQAALNIFPSRLATGMGMTGANKSYVMTYVPALVFTLYDGYYIYMPTNRLWNDSSKTWVNISPSHELKSYIHYSREYKDSTGKVLVINYSLDNYVAIYYSSGGGYISIARIFGRQSRKK